MRISASVSWSFLGTREVYQALGIMCLAIGVDKSVEQSNIVSLIVKIVFGVILVLS